MTGTSLMNYEEKWAQEAKAAAVAEPLQAGTWLSARGGQLAIGETVLPGAQAAVIVLDMVRENTYYEGKFDPDNPMPPVCYALGRESDEMFPHLDMQKDLSYFKPQHVENGQVLGCDGCPLNQWGSADQGRGKACQNRRRLTLIPAGYYTPRKGSRDFDLQLFDDPEHFAKTEQVFFKLPVTSVNNWSKYVNQVATALRRPPHGVVTRLSIEPHQQFQYEVRFEAVEAIPDELAEVLMSRHAAAIEAPLLGYQPPDPNATPRGGPRSGPVRGLRR